MGCCGNSKRGKATYYENRFDIRKKSSLNNSIDNKDVKDCAVKYEDLLRLFSDIPTASIQEEEKSELRYQITKWISDIYKTCPDENKYKNIVDKIYGTNTSKD